MFTEINPNFLLSPPPPLSPFLFTLLRSASTYQSLSPPSTSFLSYLSTHLPDSPSKRLRFKTILFLQGSTRYDLEAVRSRLEEGLSEEEKGWGLDAILALEKAIVFGKVRVLLLFLSFLCPLPFLRLLLLLLFQVGTP